MVGLSKGALDSAVTYIHEREAFSQKIADFQVSLPTSILGIAFSIACGITICMKVLVYLFTTRLLVG